MKSLVIYDSLYGNTEKIAQAVANSASAKAVRLTKIATSILKGIDLLVIGSPTQGGRATTTMNEWLTGLPDNALTGIKIAVFDTRLLEEDLNFALKLLVRTIGYAAPKMTKLLESKGGKLLFPPEGFIVIGKEGPLASGEIERAKRWLRL